MSCSCGGWKCTLRKTPGLRLVAGDVRLGAILTDFYSMGRTMLTVKDALAAILENVSVADVQNVALTDSLGLVLAEDLATPHDSPPFAKSMMDGFVVNSAGFAGDEERTLAVGETITAGTVPQQPVQPDAAARIMTGAPIPELADCVIPIERVAFDESKPQSVTISGEFVTAGRHILQQGASAQKDTLLMSRGTKLQPQHIAVLAEFGMATLPVFRPPTVAVLATGDELLSVDQPLSAGRIRNSNEPMLAAQIHRAGGVAMPLGIAKDSRDDLRHRIARGLECDFLLLSGGVSAGTLDLVPSELAAAGVQQVFHKIQMKPGKPLWFGRADGERSCRVFGLPGNPVSSMICFELFVRAALWKHCGLPDDAPATLSAKLTEDVTVKGDRVTWFPMRLQYSPAGLTATPVPWGGSADLRSTADANGMAELNPQTEPYTVGNSVEVIWW